MFVGKGVVRLCTTLPMEWDSEVACRGDWGSLPPGIIDAVLRLLSASPLWRREAPTLRLVNRRWCQEVDRHVVTVFPHHSREIQSDDLPALLKFNQLTSLDATRFVRAYEATHLPSIHVLSRLGHLTKLELQNDSWNGIGVGALLTLRGLTSLTLETGVQTHVPEKDLKTLTQLPLRELSIRCPIQKMASFFEGCRSLERLTAQALPGDFDFSFDPVIMNGLTALKLSFRPVGHSFEIPDLQSLSRVTSLQELDLTSFCSNDLEWLLHLSSLRQLSVTVAATAVVSSVAFLHVVQRLMQFRVKSIASQSLDITDVIRRGTALKELHLENFAIDCRSIQENLGALESLALHKCSLQNSQYFLEDLKPLGRLAVQCLRDPFAHLRLGSADLSRLSVLKVALHEVDSIAVICRLRHLISLGLRTPYPLSVDALKQLGTLPNLLEFGVSPPFPESTVSVFLKSDAVKHLEILYLSDEDSNFNASSLQWLKSSVPQLKIETRVSFFDSFMKVL